MKVHSFYIEEAEKHGVEKAVILYNLRFWLEKNKANKTNEHDGYYWTFNSAKAFAELFPYFGQRKIARLLQQLEDENVILSGCYNERKYDRTKWYSLPEFKVENDKKHTCNACNQTFVKNDKAICEKCLKGLSEVSKGIVKTVQPIPDINTDDKPDSKPVIAFDEFWEAYDKKIDRAKCLAKWEKLTAQQHQEIMSNVHAYVAANNVKQYRKNPLTYLNGECWLDEIITSQPTNKKANSDLPAWQQTYVPPTFNANDIQRPVELSEEEKKRASEQLKQARKEFLL